MTDGGLVGMILWVARCGLGLVVRFYHFGDGLLGCGVVVWSFLLPVVCLWWGGEVGFGVFVCNSSAGMCPFVLQFLPFVGVAVI